MTTPQPVVRVCTLDLAILRRDGRVAQARARRAALAALSGDEWDRARPIRSADQRMEWMLTRGVLRLLLGEAVGRAPHALGFALGAHGKPYLPDHPELHFNVSHTTGRALVALTHAGPVGVDVERLDRRLACEPLPDLVFSARTRHAIAAVSSQRRAEVFFRCWVRYEAMLKATGVGLVGAGGGLDVPVGDCIQSHDGLAARDLQLEDLPSSGGYVAAVALVCAGDGPSFVVVDEPIPHRDQKIRPVPDLSSASRSLRSFRLGGLPGGDGAEHPVYEGRRLVGGELGDQTDGF